jgi:hypothetical protein
VLDNAYPVTDPTTDLDAAADNKARNNNAGMTHTQCRAWVRFYAANPVTDPASNVHDAVWGDAIADKPVCARTGVGIFTVTWPSTVDNLLSQAGATAAQGGETGISVNIRTAKAWAASGTTFRYATATVTSANVVTVHVFDAAGALVDPSASTCLVTVEVT